VSLNSENRDPYTVYQCIRDRVTISIAEMIERVRSRRLYVAVLKSLDDLGRRSEPVVQLDPIAKEMVKGNHECMDDIVSFMQEGRAVSDELASLKEFLPFDARTKETRFRSKEGKLIRLVKSLIHVLHSS